jgi:hypothetical protein
MIAISELKEMKLKYDIGLESLTKENDWLQKLYMKYFAMVLKI